MAPLTLPPAVDHDSAVSAWMASREWSHTLRCPRCRGGLQPSAETLRCLDDACGLAFPFAGDVPVLVDERASVFDMQTFLEARPTFFRPTGRVRGWISRRLPDLTWNTTGARNFDRLAAELLSRTPRPRVLVVGGGVMGAGMQRLAGHPSIELVESDVSLGTRTQLVCDGHQLPFADECLDGVVVQAVLEHVVDPAACVAEIHRVLKPRGLVYADTPFMQQVHGRQFDFTRFTRLGHRRLFRRFRQVDAGITCGPAVALAWSIRYFLLSFFQSRSMRAAASGACRCGLFWLKYVDRYLVTRPGAQDAASSFYFLGEKSSSILDDRQLLASYQGGF